MSNDLTALIAISFLIVATLYVVVLCSNIANDLSEQIVTGVVRGTPVSRGVREGILFGTWLPAELSMVILTAFLSLAMLEAANHVSGANVKLLAQLAAFLAGTGSAFVFTVASIAFFRYRAKLRRVRRHQAEAG